jgi:hypothetical protein
MFGSVSIETRQKTASIETIMHKSREHDEEKYQKLVSWQKFVKTKGASKDYPIRLYVAPFSNV